MYFSLDRMLLTVEMPPLVLAARSGYSISSEPLGDTVVGHPLKEQPVNALDNEGLLRIDHQITVWPAVIAEEALEWNGDLAVCKAFPLPPCAVL